MSLKRKIVAAMALLVTVMVCLNYVILRSTMLPSFDSIERDHVASQTQRLTSAIDGEIEALAPIARGWANWDEVRDFVAGSRPDFPHHLSDKTFISIDLDVIYFYDGRNRLAWGWGVTDRGEHYQLAALDPARSSAMAAQLHGLDAGGTGQGVIWTTRGPMMIVLQGVYDGEGNRIGAALFGRLLDNPTVVTLLHRTGVDADIVPLSPRDIAQQPDLFSLAEKPRIHTPDARTLQETAIYRDLAGTPILKLQVRIPRSITAVGDAAVRSTLISLTALGLADMLLMGVMLQLVVLRPLERMERHMAHQGEAESFDAPLPQTRQDELGVLAREYNRMMKRLAELQTRIEQQSFDSGRAEAAAGALHNIRNTLNPLVNRLDDLSGRVAGLPGNHLVRAIDELLQPHTAPDRMAQLGSYARASSEALERERLALSEEVRTVCRQALSVGEILDGQVGDAYARVTLGPVDAHQVAAHAADMLRAQFPALAVDVAILGAANTVVHSNRVLLSQVVHNLMINAAEAIGATGRAEGRIAVDLVQARLEGQPALIVSVTDNGIGIAAERLESLFARAPSSKHKNRGIGLHWCANSAAAMHGRLTVSSPGTDRGASFDLTLPLASTANQGASNVHLAHA